MDGFTSNVLFAYYEQDLEEEYNERMGNNDLREISESKGTTSNNELKEKWEK